jgi:hypothetical protein
MSKTQDILSRFPHFYRSEDTHSLIYQFIKVFGRILDEGESDLLKVMYAHYADKADNEGSQGFNTTQKGDLDKLFSLYLENLGGTSQLKQIDRPSGEKGLASDAIYRQRIKGLIEILKNGASTQEGIIAIVAANLGIVGDDPQAIDAREQIRITEFLPQPLSTDLYELAIFEPFTVINPNVIDTVPEIRLHFSSDLTVPLNNPRLVNLTSGKFVQYEGVVKHDDVLSFFADGTAFFNGVSIAVGEKTPPLSPGESSWRLEASFGLAKARFDSTLFDFSALEQERLNSIAQFDVVGSNFDEAVFPLSSKVVKIGMTLFKLTPAAFRVDIPWDIPPFTDKLDQLSDRPREQIKYIVDKVKAAGVFAVIAYEKQFTESQEMADSFKGIAQRQPFPENQEMEEVNFDIGSIQIPYAGGIVHEMSDTLIVSGLFDYTQFDSLNTFA